MTPTIVTAQLSKMYGPLWAVRDLNLQVPAGAVTALLGPNGAGKSTTLAILLGLIRPTSGSVTVFGEPWRRDHLRRIGASINGPALYRHLSAVEHLEVHARLLGLSPARVQATLDLAGLGAVGRKPVAQYSTGMQSRLALAIALLAEPDCLILDEPQNGLDPEGIRELRDLLREYARAGRTILVSSHILGEVVQLADHVAVIAQGQLRFQGPLGALNADSVQIEEAYLALTRRIV